MWRHFAFVDDDMTPIGSAISDSHLEKDELQPPVLNIILPGCQHKVLEPFLVFDCFKHQVYADLVM